MAAKKKKPEPVEEEVDLEDDQADDVDDLAPGTDVTQRTLERARFRASKFLGAVAESTVIRALLAKRGWDYEAHVEGRNLLMDVLTPTPSLSEAANRKKVEEADQKVAAAVATLDDLDEGHFKIAKAALVHNFPAQHDALFFELEPSTGYEAVIGWRTFLTRVQAMRESKKEADKGALALLAKRALGPEELKRIEKLVTVAEGSEAASTLSLVTSTEAAERTEKLRRLRTWLLQWIPVANVEVKAKALRIKLGISKRKRGGGGGGGGGGTGGGSGAPPA